MKFLTAPVPLPILTDMATLKLILGLGLFLAGILVFSLWKERLFSLKEEDRAKFLMFNVVGGSWLLAIFSLCGGIYFLFDSIFAFTA